MSDLVKDIVDVCLKEDLQKVLRKTTELKEMSAFGREFAQQMKQKGEGGVYRSKITGQNIRLQYSAPKPMDRISPEQYAKEKGMAKQNMAAPATSATPAQAAEPKNDIKQQYGTPEDLAKDINRAKSMPKVAPQIRSATPQASPAPNTRSADQIPGMGPRIQNYYDRKLSADKVAPEAPAPMATPKASETPKDDTSTVSSALKNKLSPSQLGSNPENLVNKDVLKGREPKSMNESFVSVGTNKYRIV